MPSDGRNGGSAPKLLRCWQADTRAPQAHDLLASLAVVDAGPRSAVAGSVTRHHVLMSAAMIMVERPGFFEFTLRGNF
jgi:hypothetical protein